MVATQGGHPPFKGDSPHLRPQQSRTGSSPTRSKILPLRHGGWVPRVMQAGLGQKEPKPPRAERTIAQRLQAVLHFRPDQRVKGRTAMQAACNRTKGAHPFDFDASSMEAQAHTSCNRRAGYYVRETAPPLAPVPRLLDCGTGAATCNTPSNPWTGGTHSWQLSRIIYCPHRPTRVFCAHFVLTHAHPRKLPEIGFRKRRCTLLV
jgi:hypothetical protein